MAEFSWSGRVVKAVIGPVLLCGWWYFAPFSTFFVFIVPLGNLPIREIVLDAGYLLLALPLLYQTISWWYEAWPGREATEGKEVMSWLKYIWATLIGFVAMIIFVVSAAYLIVWLTISRVVAYGCGPMPRPISDCGGWVGLAWAFTVAKGCALVGLFIGAFVGTIVAIRFYRRHQSLNPTMSTGSLFD
jgi:hypothetical protein